MNYHICTQSISALEYSLQGSSSAEGYLDLYNDTELESLAAILQTQSNVIMRQIIKALENIEKTAIESIAELLQKKRLLQNVIAVIGNVEKARKGEKEGAS